MENTHATLLVVDDEPFNIEILREHLEDQGYNVISAEDGDVALNIINSNKYSFDAVLLDRMMPEVDGMQVLKNLKHDDKYKHIPVIMQTAAATNEEVIEGIEAGAFYYLTKPYEADMLLSIIEAAIQDSKRYQKILLSSTTFDSASHLVKEIAFDFRTIDEAELIAAIISKLAPDKERLIIGLTELMINAIEHGNLDIGYELKTELITNNKWKEEVAVRLNDAQYRERTAHIKCLKKKNEMLITIMDEGNGFDPAPFMNIDSKRANESHGRGIAIANMMSFDELIYKGKNNEVDCSVRF